MDYSQGAVGVAAHRGGREQARGGAGMCEQRSGIATPVRVAAAVADHLSSRGYDWMTERDLQSAVADRLCERFEVSREKALSRRDRPDFLVAGTGFDVAVEVKVKGPRNAVLRQLGRYAAHGEVGAVVLASARRTLLAGIPSMIHGKPVAVALLAGEL